MGGKKASRKIAKAAAFKVKRAAIMLKSYRLSKSVGYKTMSSTKHKAHGATRSYKAALVRAKGHCKKLARKARKLNKKYAHLKGSLKKWMKKNPYMAKKSRGKSTKKKTHEEVLLNLLEESESAGLGYC